MRTAASILAAGLAAALAAGCGSSGHSTSGTTTAASAPPPSSPAATPANAPPAVRAIAGRVLVAGDIPGFKPQGQRTLGINAHTWVVEEHLSPPEASKEVARLQALGFIRAVSERLVPSVENGPEALSVVNQFHAPASATAQVQDEVKTSQAHGAKTFTVSGIPGARGFGAVSGVTTGYNVAFAVGPYYYLVGVGYPTGVHGAPTREQLITAAQHLYARVHR